MLYVLRLYRDIIKITTFILGNSVILTFKPGEDSHDQGFTVEKK